MAAHSCSEYSILLDKGRDAAFYPGDVISGRVVITTTSAMQCRGIRVRLQGVAEGKWHTGSGDNRRDYHTKRTYVSLRHTLFGNFYRTVLLDEAGAEAYFDARVGRWHARRRARLGSDGPWRRLGGRDEGVAAGRTGAENRGGGLIDR